MTDFIKVTNKADLADGAILLVEADERLVILSRAGDDILVKINEDA